MSSNSDMIYFHLVYYFVPSYQLLVRTCKTSVLVYKVSGTGILKTKQSIRVNKPDGTSWAIINVNMLMTCCCSVNLFKHDKFKHMSFFF